ncbi:MAG: hypothetical protein KF874_07105 [Rhizobiaceae bacterium]|nr:hypothetical protein [Rhizobiaceae bacterium]
MKYLPRSNAKPTVDEAPPPEQRRDSCDRAIHKVGNLLLALMDHLVSKAKAKYERTKQIEASDERPASWGSKPRFYENWDAAFNRDITDEQRFWIEYSDENGEVTEREIRPISIHLIRESYIVYIKSLCYLRREMRTFRSDRILSARNLKTNRSIIDLGQYLRSRY